MGRRSYPYKRRGSNNSKGACNAVTHADIDKATNMEDLKKLLHRMVDTQNAVSNAVSKGVTSGVQLDPSKMTPKDVDKLISVVNGHRATIRQAFSLTLPVHKADFNEGYIDEDVMKELFKSDGLINIIYVKSTRKEWKCCECEETLEISSEAFRSEFFNGRDYIKLYRCTPCFKKRAEDVKYEASEANHTIALYASQGIQD